MAKKNDVILQIANVSLLTIPEAIKRKFEKFKDLVIKPSSVKDFEVINDESLALAESKIKTINGLKTQIIEVENELKNPLNSLKTMVLNESKAYLEDLTMSKSVLNTKAITYKDLKAAQLKISEEANRAKLQEEVDRKADIISRIDRILGNITSLLFGGDIVNNEGEENYVDTPASIEDLEKVKEYIKDAFPDFDVFQEFQGDMVKHYNNFMSDIEIYKTYITNGDVENIRKLKIKYYALCERNADQVKKIIEKEEKKIDKQINTEIKDATKGIRQTIRYDVENLAQVPERFKMVDEKLVNEYKKRNNEKIDAAIKNGTSHDLIPGIKFRYERKNISY